MNALLHLDAFKYAPPRSYPHLIMSLLAGKGVTRILPHSPPQNLPEYHQEKHQKGHYILRMHEERMQFACCVPLLNMALPPNLFSYCPYF